MPKSSKVSQNVVARDHVPVEPPQASAGELEAWISEHLDLKSIVHVQCERNKAGDGTLDWATGWESRAEVATSETGTVRQTDKRNPRRGKRGIEKET